jgi:2-methylisocitrate lyase-like PEP mutase family enzyme
VERLRAARGAIDRSGQDVMLIGRSEGFLVGRPDLAETIDRLRAYADAGADCLYAPGILDLDALGRIVEAVAPKPVNVLIGRPGLSVADVARIGARRISVGGALAAAAWKGFDAAVTRLLDEGTLPPRT